MLLLAGALLLTAPPERLWAQGTWEIDLPGDEESDATEDDEEPVGTAADVPAADDEGEAPVLPGVYEPADVQETGGGEEGASHGIEWGVVPSDAPPAGEAPGEAAAPRGGSQAEEASPEVASEGGDGASGGGEAGAAAGAEGSGTASDEGGAEAKAPVGAVDLLLPEQAPDEIARLWQARRQDLVEMDPSAAREKEEAILELRRSLAIESLPVVAEALVREGRADFEQGRTKEGLRKARLAVELAPSAAEAERFLARAVLLTSPGSVGEILSTFTSSLIRPFSRLPTRRLLLANLLALLLLALAGTLLVLLVVTFLGRLRLFLHDFHHRLPRGTSLLQSSVVVLLFLLLPCVLGVGVLPALLLPAIAAWPYEGAARRALLLGALLVVGLTPLATDGLLQAGRFWETRAADVWRVEHTGSWGDALDRLRSRAEAGEATYPELFALARAEKRLGHLERALRLYEEAEGRGGASDAALHNNLGVVRLALGDLEGAKEGFQKAVSIDGALAAAYHNLAKVYFKGKELSKGQVARRKAMDLDRALVEAHPDTEPRLNVALVDVPLDDRWLRPLLAEPRGPEPSRQVRVHLASLLPEIGAPALTLAALAIVFLGGTLRERLGVAGPCARCGRPVCRRCDREVQASLCGQCVNVFERKGVVAPEVRQTKERAIRRRRILLDRLELVAAIVLPGTGALLAGRLLLGLSLLFLTIFGGAGLLLWNGPLPDASWVEGAPPTWRIVGCALLLLLAWIGSIWTTLRQR